MTGNAIQMIINDKSLIFQNQVYMHCEKLSNFIYIKGKKITHIFIVLPEQVYKIKKVNSNNIVVLHSSNASIMRT